MADFLDQFTSAATRPHALEVLIIAHLALDRDFLKDRHMPAVSREGKIAIRYARQELPGVALSAIGAYHHDWDQPEPLRDAAAMLVEEAISLTIWDATFYSRETLLLEVGATPLVPRTKIGRLLESTRAELRR